MTADNEREWSYWRGDYRTRGQAEDIRFIPLYEVRDEVFTVYFPVQATPGPGSAAILGGKLG